MNKQIILIGLALLSFSAQSLASQTWTCDSGFKSSLGSAYVSQLKLNANGKYDLAVGSSPSDVGSSQVVGPLKVISDLDCKFSKENNGIIVDCSNGQNVDEWFSLKSSYNTTTSMDYDGNIGTQSYAEVIISSGDKKVSALLKKLSGDKEVVRYNVLLDLPNSKCGF